MDSASFAKWSALAWVVFTFAANLFFRAESGQSAVAWLSSNKWGVRFLAACQHLGFDFIGFWNCAASYFQGNPPPPFGGASAAARATSTMLPPRPLYAAERRVPALALNACALGAVFVLSGCAAWNGFWTSTRVQAVEDVTECVIMKSAAAFLASGTISPIVEISIAVQCGSDQGDVHAIINGNGPAIERAKQELTAARAAGLASK